MLVECRRRSKNLPVSPEGFPCILLSLILVLLFPGSPFPYLLLLSFVLFFRNPRRIPSGDPRLVVSPADGKIISIKREGGEVTVSIFMSLLDVHVNRAPLPGRVTGISYKKGKFYPAFRKDLTKDNERNTITFTFKNFSYKVSQVAGIVARRIVCYLATGDEVEKGEVIGIICFGSLVEATFPEDRVDITVVEGKKVKAGKSVIGVLR